MTNSKLKLLREDWDKMEEQICKDMMDAIPVEEPNEETKQLIEDLHKQTTNMYAGAYSIHIVGEVALPFKKDDK